MKDQVQYFENQFCYLVDKACQEVNGKLEPPIFLSRVTCLPVSARTQHRSFIKKNLINIPSPVTFENIWSILNLYWDFLNYGLLEHVINRCGSNDLKQEMQDYVEELSTFKQTTRLCDFIESWPSRDNGPPEDHLKKVVVKMKQDWCQCTLQDVESFMKDLVDKFFLPEFDILLQKAERGCVCVTWLTSPSIATLLQQNLANIETEFFKKHGIDAVTIDGQDVHLTPVKRYSGYLRDLYNSEQCPVGIGPPVCTEKLFPFKLARIEKEKVTINEFTRQYLRGDLDDVGSLGTEFYKKFPIKFEEVGKPSRHLRQKLILIEGAPGVGKTTFSWEFCRKWGRGEILQDHSLLLLLPLRGNKLKEAKTLSDLFYHPNSELQQAVVQEITSNQGQGVAIWLEAWDELDHEPREKASVFLDLIHGKILPFTTVFVTSRPWASKHLRENCEDRITQHVEILTSAKDQIEHYISKAEAEAQPSSFAAEFTDYLSSNPVIRAAMYTPITAKMVAEVFTWSQHTESPPPTTMTELFTAFTLKALVDYLSTHPVYQKQQLKVTFGDLPTDVYKQFQDLCRMAYEGMNRQQLVFSAAHLTTGFDTLGLMQEVPQLYTESRASSYHFIHLTLQEYLAAVHISRLSAHEQTRLFQEHLNSGHFKMTMRFLAGCTKLVSIPLETTRRSVKSDDTKLSYFHFLFETKDTSVTARSLGSEAMIIESHYSWTPLDYYVTGHAIPLSNCSWHLNFTSIDDDKFELFCQGCAMLGEAKCSGCISHANFSFCDITSKSILSFVNIPPHILWGMRKLDLMGNKLNGSACDVLAKALSSMSKLEELAFDCNPIGSGGAVKMIKNLCDSGVRLLRLNDTRIGMPDCEALCELLKSSHSLEDLRIKRNKFTSESVGSIITGLSQNSSLKELRMSDSHFRMTNMVSLASVLRDQSRCTLVLLKLRDCQISSEGAVQLTAGLCKNSTIRALYLTQNPIGEGAIAVAEMLVENKTLTRLEVDHCNINSHGACELAMALCKNSTLKHLMLDHNPIGMAGAFSMSDMLQHNTSLEELSLLDDSIGEEGILQLMNGLKHNQTLEVLRLPEKYKLETSEERIYWL